MVWGAGVKDFSPTRTWNACGRLFGEYYGGELDVSCIYIENIRSNLIIPLTEGMIHASKSVSHG